MSVPRIFIIFKEPFKLSSVDLDDNTHLDYTDQERIIPSGASKIIKYSQSSERTEETKETK